MLDFYKKQKDMYIRKSNGHHHYIYAIKIYEELIIKEEKNEYKRFKEIKRKKTIKG